MYRIQGQVKNVCIPDHKYVLNKVNVFVFYVKSKLIVIFCSWLIIGHTLPTISQRIKVMRTLVVFLMVFKIFPQSMLKFQRKFKSIHKQVRNLKFQQLFIVKPVSIFVKRN